MCFICHMHTNEYNVCRTMQGIQQASVQMYITGNCSQVCLHIQTMSSAQWSHTTTCFILIHEHNISCEHTLRLQLVQYAHLQKNSLAFPNNEIPPLPTVHHAPSHQRLTHIWSNTAELIQEHSTWALGGDSPDRCTGWLGAGELPSHHH